MMIHLKKNEKIFINGAVIRLDRRGSIELLNDAQFLLASHIMQVEQASTPLRRLYFIVQTMLIDPANSALTKSLYDSHVSQLLAVIDRPNYRTLLLSLNELVEATEYFEALKLLRKNYEIDNELQATSKTPTEIAAPRAEASKAA